jgi:hypothetical protein
MSELGEHMNQLRRSMARISGLAKILFPDFPEHPVGSFEWPKPKLEERLEGVMDRLADSLVLFRGTERCVGKARDRLWSAHPPASRAKQEFKDCEIFEEFLELVSTLRSQGFDQTAVFVTPNARDYGQPPQGYPRICADLAACGAKYAANLSWAQALLRSSGS